MYKHILRPILFLFNPEAVHRFTAAILRFTVKIPGMEFILKSFFSLRNPLLEKEVLGLKFPNPVGLAAGFDKNANCFKGMSALGFGFIEVGTVTPKAQQGNARPRLFRLPLDNAIINRMGFNNQGVENMVKNLRKRDKQVIIGGNLGKNTSTPNAEAPSDYLLMFRKLYEYVDYFVVNVSCPNVTDVTALQNRESLLAILNGLFEFRRGQNNYRPVLLKISPDLTYEQIDEIVDILIETPLDGLVAINTTTDRNNMKTDPVTLEKIGNGGLSGAPLTAKAIEIIKYLSIKTEGRYPIIGVGGIMKPEDAKDMLDAGASLVQVYSGFIYEGPGFVKKICKLLQH